MGGLHGVPITMLNYRGVRKLASRVGKIITVKEGCISLRKATYVRAKVWIEPGNPLTPSFHITKRNEVEEPEPTAWYPADIPDGDDSDNEDGGNADDDSDDDNDPGHSPQNSNDQHWDATMDAASDPTVPHTFQNGHLDNGHVNSGYGGRGEDREDLVESNIELQSSSESSTCSSLKVRARRLKKSSKKHKRALKPAFCMQAWDLDSGDGSDDSLDCYNIRMADSDIEMQHELEIDVAGTLRRSI
ncbi:OLC1v1013371C1 [Oldenlandia corymbosa var. corymbosa]|uniref:OLC1v1013371C1 n=1 Tax=Oldenlandia corymbosa var. corymbosa TaxID=529605 RepID=A0AAV1DYE5_OLDCO|nr:OLC1v1013371C1 [Oldenlandia corymbosa var. corymbosa]